MQVVDLFAGLYRWRGQLERLAEVVRRVGLVSPFAFTRASFLFLLGSLLYHKIGEGI